MYVLIENVVNVVATVNFINAFSIYDIIQTSNQPFMHGIKDELAIKPIHSMV